MSKKPEPITAEKEVEIIEYFKSNEENSLPKMSKHFGISIERISKIVDHYLIPKFNK